MRPIAACLSGLLLAFPACANTAQDRPGVYAGISVGTARGPSKVYEHGTDVSMGLNLGYRFNRNLAAELFRRSLNFNLLPGLSGGYNYPDVHTGLALRFGTPLSEDFSLYGRLGAGRTKMRGSRPSIGSNNVSEGSAGIGIGYGGSSIGSFGWHLEYNRFLKNDINVYSLGVEYRF